MPPAPHFRTIALDTAKAGRPPACGFVYSEPPKADDAYAGSLWRFWRSLPVADPRQAVTLGEGGTPLIASRLFRGRRIFLKDETRNPTGSHKDRALTVAATHAREQGARLLAVVSAGSTGLSAAAYAARAGLASLTLMARGAPPERIYPAFALGSRIVEVDAGIDDIIKALQDLADRPGLYVASTTRRSNAHQAEGAKTVSYEIVEALGDAPDWMVVPVGGGGTIAGIHRGFAELRAAGRITRLPRLAGVVPSAYDALAVAFRRGIDQPEAFQSLPYRDDVPTVLTKLSHAHPPDGLEALAAVRASGGTVIALSDEAALDAVSRLGAGDGLYLEPSAAIVVPAVDRLIADGMLRSSDVVVALACGSGFRESFALTAARPRRAEAVRFNDVGTVITDALRG